MGPPAGTIISAHQPAVLNTKIGIFWIRQEKGSLQADRWPVGRVIVDFFKKANSQMGHFGTISRQQLIVLIFNMAENYVAAR